MLAILRHSLFNYHKLCLITCVMGGCWLNMAFADAPPPVQLATEQMSAAQFEQWLQNNNNNAPPPNLAPPGSTPQMINAPGSPPQNSPPPPGSPLPPVTASQGLPTPPPVKLIPKFPEPPPPMNFAQSQQTMVNSLPPTKNVSPEANIAFNAMLRQNMPLNPQQVVQLHQQIDLAQRAAAVPPNVPPKPVSNTIMVNLAPGATPPAVRIAQGYVTSLVFVDSTGTPWPIAAFDIGNPKAVNIQWDGKSNIILLQAVSPYSDGDIVVRLAGLPTPITLELVAGQRVVDFRVDVHVSGIGPNTKELPLGTTLPDSANQLLLEVLDGIAPAGSKSLVVRGADAQSWLLGEKMYMRTRFTVLSPGWVGRMVSPDGMQAYELPKTSSVLISRYGEPAELKIEGF